MYTQICLSGWLGGPVPDPEGHQPLSLGDWPPHLRGGPVRQEEGQGVPLHPGQAQGQVSHIPFHFFLSILSFLWWRREGGLKVTVRFV